MNEQAKELDKHIARLMAEITEAASKHDLAAFQRLSNKAAELQELKDQIAAIQHRIGKLSGQADASSKVAASEVTNGHLREMPVEVTDGMIRQNLLTLTPHIKKGDRKSVV